MIKVILPCSMEVEGPRWTTRAARIINNLFTAMNSVACRSRSQNLPCRATRELWAQFVDHATSPSPAWLWSADGSRFSGPMRSARRSSALRILPHSPVGASRQNNPRPWRFSASLKRCHRPGKHDLKDCGASAPALVTRLRASARVSRCPTAPGGTRRRQRARGTSAAAWREGQASVLRPIRGEGGVRTGWHAARRQCGGAESNLPEPQRCPRLG